MRFAVAVTISERYVSLKKSLELFVKSARKSAGGRLACFLATACCPSVCGVCLLWAKTKRKKRNKSSCVMGMSTYFASKFLEALHDTPSSRFRLHLGSFPPPLIAGSHGSASPHRRKSTHTATHTHYLRVSMLSKGKRCPPKLGSSESEERALQGSGTLILSLSSRGTLDAR